MSRQKGSYCRQKGLSCIKYSNLDAVHDSGVPFPVSQPIGNDVI